MLDGRNRGRQELLLVRTMEACNFTKSLPDAQSCGEGGDVEGVCEGEGQGRDSGRDRTTYAGWGTTVVRGRPISSPCCIEGRSIIFYDKGPVHNFSKKGGLNVTG